MHIKNTWLTVSLLSLLAFPAHAGDYVPFYDDLPLYLELGVGANNNSEDFMEWDVNAVVGSKQNLDLQFEGERAHGVTEELTLWAIYSPEGALPGDAAIGIRHETKPYSLTHGVLVWELIGIETLLFISDDGDFSVRLEQEKDFVLTPNLTVQPYWEVNLFADDIPELEVGAGLESGEFGVRFSYELAKNFTPYVDFRYERLFGETSSIAKSNNEENDALVGSLGIQLFP